MVTIISTSCIILGNWFWFLNIASEQVIHVIYLACARLYVSVPVYIEIMWVKSLNIAFFSRLQLSIGISHKLWPLFQIRRKVGWNQLGQSCAKKRFRSYIAMGGLFQMKLGALSNYMVWFVKRWFLTNVASVLNRIMELISFSFTF